MAESPITRRDKSTSMRGLTRSIGDRIFLGLPCIVFAPISLLILLTSLMGVLPDERLLRLLVIVLYEGAGAVFVGSILGLIWAVWMPDWVERLIRKVVQHIAVTVILFSMVLVAMLFSL